MSERPTEQGIQSKLYRKKLNKHMYIPWSSAHPDSVKKSFIKAELTRFMYLSSQKRYFEESKRMFYMNLRRRGYPADTLETWFKQVDYRNRQLVVQTSSLKPAKRQIPLLLPSEYNEVWKYINTREVFDAVKHEWTRNGNPIPDNLQGPLIKCLRRTENFSDKFSKWNNEQLRPTGVHKKRSYLMAFRSLGEDLPRTKKSRSPPPGWVEVREGDLVRLVKLA
jgi:hypothetical protein